MSNEGETPSAHLASLGEDVGGFRGGTHLWGLILTCAGHLEHFEAILYYFDEVDLPELGNLLYFDHVYLTFDEDTHLMRLLHIF
jgi:hypothetical protein